jgi:polyphosphate:AMP phosphotransferase
LLESAEIGHRVAKNVYDRQLPKLREALLNAQYDMAHGEHGPLLILFSGIEGGGRSETANTLNEWMDPRHIHTVAFGPRNCEELARPNAWRYWHALPPRGRTGIFMNAWYNEAIVAHFKGKIDRDALEFQLTNIRHYERMFVDEGFAILKFWIHLSRDAARRRLKELAKQKDRRWELTPDVLERTKSYYKLRDVWEEVLRESSTGEAPWYVVEGEDPRYRSLTVGKIVLDTLQRATATRSARARGSRGPAPAPPAIDNVLLIRNLDLSKKLSEKEYDKAMPKYQGKLAQLTRTKRFTKHSLVLVFEGADAAGKGGAIRRVTGALDARQYVTVPVAAPTDEEKLYPYLWRFWRNIPGLGGITIFDRSWYGRVLVERVEGFAPEYDWRRAYDEINQFEEQLVEGNAIVCKFWLQISKAEQLRRFKAREKTSFKRFKITPEDWRNREKWNEYEHAIADMVDRTSTEIAPWTLVEAADKRYARVKILKTIVTRLEKGFD